MIQVGNKIISREILEEHFVCNLERCEGNCCVFGDSGAPLEEDEARLLDDHIMVIRCFMRPEGIRAIREQGNWVVDDDGDRVTPLVGREECAYTVFEEGIARCAIEMAYEAGTLSFQKPVSCHIYPIRLSRLNNNIALNYHRWSICEPARLLGNVKQIPVFRFLREPIIRVFGMEFYDELETIYSELPDRLQKPVRKADPK